MRNTLVKIDLTTYFFLFLCFLAGYMKQAFLLMFIVLIHETGHIFFIKKFGYRILNFTLYPFGGYITIDKKINTSITKDIWIALGGILAQLLLFLLLYLFSNHFVLSTYQLLITYNTTILFFNLLPIVPLDGFKLANLICNKFFSFHFSYLFSFFLSLFSFLLFSFYLFAFKINNLYILIFLLFQLYKYIKEYKYIYHRFLLERYLDDFAYTHIENHSISVRDLKLDTLHYFKKDGRYIHEKKILAKKFDKI